MESGLSLNVMIVDITFAVGQEGHQTVKALLISSPDVAVQWRISIRVQGIVVLDLKQ